MMIDKKKILIDISHPAWVHQFRFLIKKLKNCGYEVKILAIEKECNIELLDYYNMEYEYLGKGTGVGLMQKSILFVRYFVLFFHRVLKYKPDLIIGRDSPIMLLVSFLLRKRHIAFADTEHAKLNIFFIKFFGGKVVTPRRFIIDLGQKHIRLDTFKEAFYLDPNIFQPDYKIIEKYNLDITRKVFFCRFVGWNAHHDIGHGGFSDRQKIELIQKLSHAGRVLLSSESTLPPELDQYRIKLDPWDIHTLLYYSSIFIGDSGTMAVESALLGTPAVMISPFAGMEIGNFVYLNEKGLLFPYAEFKEGIKKIEEIICENDKKKYSISAKEIFNKLVDINTWYIEEIKNNFSIVNM